MYIIRHVILSQDISKTVWDVACLIFNVRNCGDVVNALLKTKPLKGALTNSVGPDETPRNAVSHQVLRYVKHIFRNEGQNLILYESGPLLLH